MAKIIFSSLILFTSLFSEIIEIDQIEEILSHIDDSTWLLLKTNNALCGLTPFQKPISAKVLKELAYIGILYTFNRPFYPDVAAKSSREWEGDLFLLSDFNQKAKIFLKWIEMAKFRPSKIVIIDNDNASFLEMEQEMTEIKIPCSYFHYLKQIDK